MTISTFIPKIWSAALLVRFSASEVLAPTMNRDYEGEVTSGNSVRIASVTTPAVVDYKAAGRVINPQDLTDTALDLLIDQEKAFSFNVDDIDKRQAAGTMDPVSTDAASAMVEDAEAFLAALLLTNGTNVDGATPTTVASGDDAFNKVLQLAIAMDNAKVPRNDRTLAVNGAFSAFLLGASSKLSNVNTAGDANGLRMATLGMLLGFRVVSTPMLGTAKATAVAYHKSAVAYANQVDKTEALRNQNKFADILRGLHVYGGKVLRPTAVQFWKAA